MKKQHNMVAKLIGISFVIVIVGIGILYALVSQKSEKNVRGKTQLLLEKLRIASENEQKNGQLVDTSQGRFFTGASAEKMEKLHDETQAEIDAMIARPQEQRQQAIAAIRNFANDPKLKVTYQDIGASSYNSALLSEIYITKYDQYEVDVRNNHIIQFGPRPIPVSEGLQDKEADTTDRYTKAELEVKAREFIAKNAPDVQLDTLSAHVGAKEDTHCFFRWEDTTREIEGMHPFIQVGFSRGGDLLSYTNSLEL